ncbi:MAG: UDP-N-acetylglucosamine--LPS N-acetylglucosamine transferase [Actinomycetota bacterium]
MAVSSGGGHWVQLVRLREAFDHHDVVFVTVNEHYRDDLHKRDRLEIVPDATRWDKVGLVKLACRLLLLMVRYRPHVIVSTGAAPGLLALQLGKLLRAQTVWIDSIANSEEVSLSGQRAGRIADLWLTQWPHLAGDDGPDYEGAVV